MLSASRLRTAAIAAVLTAAASPAVASAQQTDLYSVTFKGHHLAHRVDHDPGSGGTIDRTKDLHAAITTRFDDMLFANKVAQRASASQSVDITDAGGFIDETITYPDEVRKGHCSWKNLADYEPRGVVYVEPTPRPGTGFHGMVTPVTTYAGDTDCDGVLDNGEANQLIATNSQLKMEFDIPASSIGAPTFTVHVANDKIPCEENFAMVSCTNDIAGDLVFTRGGGDATPDPAKGTGTTAPPTQTPPAGTTPAPSKPGGGTGDWLDRVKAHVNQYLAETETNCTVDCHGSISAYAIAKGKQAATRLGSKRVSTKANHTTTTKWKLDSSDRRAIRRGSGVVEFRANIVPDAGGTARTTTVRVRTR